MIIVDEVLKGFIKERIQEVKSTPTLLDEILQGHTVENIERFKQYLYETDIKVYQYYPRAPAEWPCYAILTEGSTESDQTIGESGEDYNEIPISNMEDGWVGSDSILLNNVVVPASDVKQMYVSLEVKDGRRVCHMIAKQDTSEGKGIFIDFENSVLEGGYISLVDVANITFKVKSNRLGSFLKFGFGKNAHNEYTFAFTITEKNVWEHIRIDIGSVENEEKDEIRYMSFVITDDSSEIDIYIDRLLGEKSTLTVYDEIYLDHRTRIESWSNNSDLTQLMHTMLLWWLLKYRTYLQNSWGFIRQRVDSADILFQPDQFPEFAYLRGLIFSCSTIEPIPREEAAAIDIQVGRVDHY